MSDLDIKRPSGAVFAGLAFVILFVFIPGAVILIATAFKFTMWLLSLLGLA